MRRRARAACLGTVVLLAACSQDIESPDFDNPFDPNGEGSDPLYL